MRDFINWLWQNKYLLMVLILPSICFVWYKLKFKKLKELAKPFFFIGVVLTALGAFLSNVAYSPQKTIQFLLLEELEVAGKFIPIGYCFIIMSVIFYLDTLFGKIFGVKERD